MARKLSSLLLLAIAFLVSYFYLSNQGLMLKQTNLDRSSQVTNSTVVQCPLHEKVCSVNLGGGLLTIQLSPNGLPALQPLTLGLSSSDILLHKTEAWVDGKDMDMGRHYFEPQDISVQAENGVQTQSFKGMIPLCSIDQNMIWRLHLVIPVGEKWEELIFDMPSVGHAGR